MKKNYSITDLESLQTRFTYMFAGPSIGLELYQGWFPTLVQLCFELDELLGERRELFYWRQIKEKFGGCRLYFAFRSEGDSDDEVELQDVSLAELRSQVFALIRTAVDQMDASCIICGEPALPASYDGYWQTLCTYHCPEVRLARGDRRPVYELSEVPSGSSKEGPA